MKKRYSNSIFITLLFSLMVIPLNTKVQYADKQDSLALVDFQNAMMQKGWPQFWDISQNVSNWSGVSINSTTGKVTKMNLNRNLFSSSFTSDSLPFCIDKLKSLDEMIDLSIYNFALKYLPEKISEFNNLKSLYLGYNSFSKIPPFLGQLENL